MTDEQHDAGTNPMAPGVPSQRRWGGGADPSLRVAGWLLVATLVAVPTYGRVAWELGAELERAAAADSIGDRITHLGRAARWKLPLASGDDAALDQLEQLGRHHAATAASDVEARLIALASFREARAALLATRGLLQWPAERARLHELDVAIAELMALEELRWYGPTHAKDATWHLERLEVASSRTRPFAFAAALSFFISAGALVIFLLRGLDDAGRLRRPWGWVWLAVTIGATVGWLVLLGRDEPADGPRATAPEDAPAGADPPASGGGGPLTRAALVALSSPLMDVS